MANRQVVGYQLVDKDGEVVQSWGGIWGQMCGVPNPIILPNGDHVLGLTGVGSVGEWNLCEWYMDEPVKVVLSDSEKLDALMTFAKQLGMEIPLK